MENDKKNEVELTVVTESALPEIIKAEIFSQVQTAREFPRSLKIFSDKAMSMATFSEEVAESCSYSVPRAGKAIEGVSVRLAEIVVSSFGNIRAGARVISNDGKTITAQGICHDLESNYCVTVEVKRRITDKYGKTFSEDMQVVTGNAGCAIAFRNAVFKVVPFAMVQPIYDKAKEVAKGTAETLVKRRDKAVEYFTSNGIKASQICDALEIKKIEDIDLDKLSTLSYMRSAVKNGETTLALCFEKKSDDIDVQDLILLFEMKKSNLSEKEIADAERIIGDLESNSYSKLQKMLQKK